VVGDGQIDWPVLLRAAAKAGVKHYFIEDEGVQPLKEIPASLRYLKTLKL
jgi:sugar phosphate isomerase/epimerase